MSKRFNTNYVGVYYRDVKRIGKSGTEKVYYIVFKKDGKAIEEKVGRQYADGMTPAKASYIRGERIEGRARSRKEVREQSKSKEWTVANLWIEYKRRNPGIKGMSQDENRFRKHVKPKFGRKEPKKITPLEIDNYKNKLLIDYQPTTVANILGLLRRIVSFGEKKHLCKGLGFTIEMPKVNYQKTEDLTPEQLQRLLDAISEDTNIQAANIMRLALFTGMRRGEMLKLKWKDLDFQHGFILIREPKGGVDQKIPMNNQVREILENHPKTAGSPFVFPGRDGRQRTNINPQVKRIKERAGLPKDFRALHGLRHVYASTLASSGKVDMYTLQKLLTNKSPSMTQRYAHLRDEALRKASDLAGELLNGEGAK